MSEAFVIPEWVRHHVPQNATINDDLNSQVRELCELLCDEPSSLARLTLALRDAKTLSVYEPAVNIACERVWLSFWDQHRREAYDKFDLLDFAVQHFPPRAKLRVVRRLSKDPDFGLRNAVSRRLRDERANEVSLPANGCEDWDRSGWLYGLKRGRTIHEGGRPQERLALPKLADVGEVRKLLNIVSQPQLGWMLLSSDMDEGPYTSFTIPKRSGGGRRICAPKSQLRRVQQRLLQEILYQIPVHRSAHGFVPGRSTVTNAKPHVGKALVIKFDLADFFPTIHYYRIVGLFGSLGYELADGRFANSDASHRVAPTLARLCSYVQNSRTSSRGYLPQGAPTSPAITNLICRKLDARLSGLARENDADYTRYADDLTFSFSADTIQVGRFRWWVDQICHQEGFFVNQQKFRVIRSSQRQMVTGIVVNETLHVPRTQRRNLRAILHNCRKHGVESQALGRPGFRAWLRGFASYVKMIHPDEGTQLVNEVNELLGGDDD